MQKAILMGRLGADPEVVNGKNGNSFISFRMAVNSTRKDGDSTWYRVTSFNEQHQKGIFPYLKKGSLVIVTGDLNIVLKDEAKGIQYNNIDVTADSIGFGPTTPKKEEGESSYTPSPKKEESVPQTSDIPPMTMEPSSTSQAYDKQDDDDDLPF